jgi:hypothetical protein
MRHKTKTTLSSIHYLCHNQCLFGSRSVRSAPQIRSPDCLQWRDNQKTSGSLPAMATSTESGYVPATSSCPLSPPAGARTTMQVGSMPPLISITNDSPFSPLSQRARPIHLHTNVPVQLFHVLTLASDFIKACSCFIRSHPSARIFNISWSASSFYFQSRPIMFSRWRCQHRRW